MKRSSKYFNLRYLVECKWPERPCFETIAAFDHEGVAADYAQTCYRGKRTDWEYRVMERKSRGYVEMKKYRCGI